MKIIVVVDLENPSKDLEYSYQKSVGTLINLNGEDNDMEAVFKQIFSKVLLRSLVCNSVLAKILVYLYSIREQGKSLKRCFSHGDTTCSKIKTVNSEWGSFQPIEVQKNLHKVMLNIKDYLLVQYFMYISQIQ